MRVRFALCFFALSGMFFSEVLSAQVHESVVGSSRHVWAGAEYSHFDPDYGLTDLDGVTLFGDVNVWHNVGGEAEVRLLDFNKPAGETEKMFLLGPTYNFYRTYRFSAFGKFLAGAGTFNYPAIGNGSYFAYEAGGGADYQFARRWKVRGEYDFDFMPSAPGIELTYPYPSNGLTPHGVSFGLAYRIF